MASSLRNQKYRKAQGLITANQIKPENWRLNAFDILRAINKTGCKAKTLKKIKYLKHQICISYWDEEGGVCSGFFSYRILNWWQYGVQKLVRDCGSLFELHNLNKLIEYEFTHYPYPAKAQAAISDTIKACINQMVESASCKRTRDVIAS